MAKNKFWDNDEMNVMMTKFKDLHITSKENKTIKVKAGINKAERDELYLQIYIKHSQMAEVVAPYLRNAQFEERCNGCVAKLYENMMFNWDLSTNRNSYGYFYRCAYTFTMDFIQGRFNGQTALYSRKYTQTGTIVIPEEKIPDNESIENYAGWLSLQSSWKDYTISTIEKVHSIKWRKQYKPFVAFDSAIYDIADEADSRWDILEDLIDWKILSEYIPDVDANDVNRQLAYILIEALQEILDNKDMALNYKALNILLYEIVQSKSPIVVSRARLLEVRNVLRQAYKYYAEDYIDFDNLNRLTTTY